MGYLRPPRDRKLEDGSLKLEKMLEARNWKYIQPPASSFSSSF